MQSKTNSYRCWSKDDFDACVAAVIDARDAGLAEMQVLQDECWSRRIELNELKVNEVFEVVNFRWFGAA